MGNSAINLSKLLLLLAGCLLFFALGTVLCFVFTTTTTSALAEVCPLNLVVTPSGTVQFRKHGDRYSQSIDKCIFTVHHLHHRPSSSAPVLYSKSSPFKLIN